MASSPRFMSLGSIFIDDIVRHDGQTRMEMLGGGGPHASFGMSLWSANVCYPALLGADFPASLLQQLRSMGVDLSALTYVTRQSDSLDAKSREQDTPLPSPRAWQIIERDGLRQHIWRTSESDFRTYFRLQPPHVDNLPLSYKQQIKGVHMITTIDRVAAMFDSFHRNMADPVVSIVEPAPNSFTPDNFDLFTSVLPHIPLFSPNLEESQRLLMPLMNSLNMPLTPSNICRVYKQQLKANNVVLRLGEVGCLALSDDDQFYYQPAYPSQSVIDATGAGNCFCGAFVVAFVEEQRNWRKALVRATVAASFTIEQWGVPSLSAPLRQEAARRCAFLESNSQNMTDAHLPTFLSPPSTDKTATDNSQAKTNSTSSGTEKEEKSKSDDAVAVDEVKDGATCWTGLLPNRSAASFAFALRYGDGLYSGGTTKEVTSLALPGKQHVTTSGGDLFGLKDAVRADVTLILKANAHKTEVAKFLSSLSPFFSHFRDYFQFAIREVDSEGTPGRKVVISVFPSDYIQNFGRHMIQTLSLQLPHPFSHIFFSAAASDSSPQSFPSAVGTSSPLSVVPSISSSSSSLSPASSSPVGGGLASLLSLLVSHLKSSTETDVKPTATPPSSVSPHTQSSASSLPSSVTKLQSSSSPSSAEASSSPIALPPSASLSSTLQTSHFRSRMEFDFDFTSSSFFHALFSFLSPSFPLPLISSLPRPVQYTLSSMKKTVSCVSSVVLQCPNRHVVLSFNNLDFAAFYSLLTNKSAPPTLATRDQFDLSAVLHELIVKFPSLAVFSELLGGLALVFSQLIASCDKTKE